jgi:hypothetical protein
MNFMEIPFKFGKVNSYFYCSYDRLSCLVGAPKSIGGIFNIYLVYIKLKYYPIIIPEIEEMMEMGVKLYRPNEYYYSHK